MTQEKASELLLSGKASFSLEVPYRLFRVQDEEAGPLFVYLHANGSNLPETEKVIAPLLAMEGYHLLIQAPYPEIQSTAQNRGYHWIPGYSDEQTITAAREYVSEFLQEVIDGVLPHIDARRLVLTGWEDSRNQLSYFCSTRPHYVNELILFGGSVNRTWLRDESERYRHIRMLALTGKDADISNDTRKIISMWLAGENESDS